MPFEQGKSGNPAGRPRDDAQTREVKRLAREHCPAAIAKLAEWMDSENPKASVAACNSLLDRGIGKAAQPIIGGDEDDPAIRVMQIERRITNANPDDPNR